VSIFWLLAISLIINLTGFLIAYRFKSDKLTDFSYGATFFVLALVAFLKISQRPYKLSKWILLAMVCAWAARLAVFLLLRILKNKKDKRFDGVRESFWKFGQFWLFQGITAWIILLPTLLFFSNPGQTIGWLGYIGFITWGSGLAVETVADYQKFTFNSKATNKGRWIASGLWRLSRHPNYFGEILNWVGVYLFTFDALNTNQRWGGVVSPLFIAFLLIFITGIPKLEKYADGKWGSDPSYQAYKKRTSILIPLPK
jgi:steroid 5-alpha reductase family enzyme